MADSIAGITTDFTDALGRISRFWGFPKGVGSIFGVLYLSPDPLSLDEIAARSQLTKGAVSTDVRALARMGLVHRSSRPGDRRDYYAAETDFYRAIRSILLERQNSEFSAAIADVRLIRARLAKAPGSNASERRFLLERLDAVCDFFDAIDSVARAVVRLDKLGLTSVQRVLSVLK